MCELGECDVCGGYARLVSVSVLSKGSWYVGVACFRSVRLEYWILILT